MDQLIVSLERPRGKPRHWIWAYCPSTHEEVIGSGWYREFSIPDGHATWWHCPACCGWHVRRLVYLDDQGPGLENGLS